MQEIFPKNCVVLRVSVPVVPTTTIVHFQRKKVNHKLEKVKIDHIFVKSNQKKGNVDFISVLPSRYSQCPTNWTQELNQQVITSTSMMLTISLDSTLGKRVKPS
jgi:peroxiredoxin